MKLVPVRIAAFFKRFWIYFYFALISVLAVKLLYPGWVFYDSAKQWGYAADLIKNGGKGFISYLINGNLYQLEITDQWPLLNTIIKVPFLRLSNGVSIYIWLQSLTFFISLYLFLDILIGKLVIKNIIAILIPIFPVFFNYSVFHSGDVPAAIFMLLAAWAFLKINDSAKYAVIMAAALGLGVLFRRNFISVAAAVIGLCIIVPEIRKVLLNKRNILMSVTIPLILMLSLYASSLNFGAIKSDVSISGMLLRMWYLYSNNELIPEARPVVEKFINEPEKGFEQKDFKGMWGNLPKKIKKNIKTTTVENANIIKKAYAKQWETRPLKTGCQLWPFFKAGLGISTPLMEFEIGRRDVVKTYDKIEMKYDSTREYLLYLHNKCLSLFNDFLLRPVYLLFLILLLGLICWIYKIKIKWIAVFFIASSYYFPLLPISTNNELRFYLPTFLVYFVISIALISHIVKELFLKYKKGLEYYHVKKV